MATITAGEFRNGVTFEMEGKVMQVVEFQHVKPGKGAAFVRTKMKNVVTGAVTETSFNPTAKFEQAFVERKDMEYSYNDGDLYYFMDMETYDMLPIGKDVLGDAFRFVKENMTCKVLSYKGNVFGVEAPNFVDLEVTDTEPGFAGNTATNVTKPATLQKQDYMSFYRTEIDAREMFDYPPFSKIIRIVLSSVNQYRAERSAEEIAMRLKDIVNRHNLTEPIAVLGATQCVLERLQENYRYQIIIKNKLEERGHRFITKFLSSVKLPNDIKMTVDVDPLDIL